MDFAVKAYRKIFGYPDLPGRVRLQYLIRTLQGHSYNSILDAGCGFGSTTVYLYENFPKAQIECCDLQAGAFGQTLLSAATNFRQDVRFFEANLKNLSIENRYDLILAMDVLEHIDDIELVLRGFQRALLRGGRLYISVPRIYPEHRELPLTEDEISWGHVRKGFVKEDLERAVLDAGFRIRISRGTFGKATLALTPPGLWINTRGSKLKDLWIHAFFPVFRPISAWTVRSGLDRLFEKNFRYTGLQILAEKVK